MTPLHPELHVIFGTGPVGLTLAEQLLAEGRAVRLVNRSGSLDEPLGAELRRGDASDARTVLDLARGATHLYHALHAPYPEWPERLPRLQENLIEAAAATGAVLVVVDTLYLYGAAGERPITEATPHLARSRKGRLRAQLAWGYLQAHRAGHARVTVGRASDFYGPRALNSALGQFFFPAALAGRPVLTLGDTTLAHSYSYVPDVARGLIALGRQEEAHGADWLLPTITPTTREVIAALAQELERPVEEFNVPDLARAQGLFDETFLHEYGELFYQYTEPQIVDSTAVERFGAFPTPLSEGLRNTLDWYRQQPTPT